MITARTRFTGKAIEVPPELQDAEPGEVIVVYDGDKGAARGSIWDTFGRAPRPRSEAEIRARLSEERDAWGSR
jgi:hypothetical protein